MTEIPKKIREKANQMQRDLHALTKTERKVLFEIIEECEERTWNVLGPSQQIAFQKEEHEKLCKLLCGAFSFRDLK